ncbi:MAG: SprT family zinc-dependent metalloprotease [Candidatus Paceibacterota bacterium]
MEKFVFGSFIYSYELIKQKRKTLSLTVTPDLKLILKCPIEVSPERIEIFLKRKWFWLEKQLGFFKKYQRKSYKKDYVSGEAFFYLGRQYRLLVKHTEKNRVALTNGKLIIDTQNSISNSNYNKKLLDEWYYKKMESIFPERITAINDRFNSKQPPKLIIKKMDKRWGSFLKNNKIILNPKLIYVSKDCIDYVITHELCHSKYKNHDKNFFNLLEKKYPNWQKTKEKLEIQGSTIN